MQENSWKNSTNSSPWNFAVKKKNKKAIEGFRFRDGMGFRLYGPAVSVPAIKTGAWRSIDLLLFYLIFSLSSRFKFSSVANFQFFIRKKN